MTHHFCDRCEKRVMSRKDLIKLIHENENPARDGKATNVLGEYCADCITELQNFLRPKQNECVRSGS